MGAIPNCVFTKEIIRFAAAMKYATPQQTKNDEVAALTAFCLVKGVSRPLGSRSPTLAGRKALRAVLESVLIFTSSRLPGSCLRILPSDSTRALLTRNVKRYITPYCRATFRLIAKKITNLTR